MSHRRWNCRWIWAPAELVPVAKVLLFDVQGTREQHALLRRSFSLDRVPERAPARLVADSRYILYANGAEVSRGPVRGDPSKLHWSPVPEIRPGT